MDNKNRVYSIEIKADVCREEMCILAGEMCNFFCKYNISLDDQENPEVRMYKALHKEINKSRAYSTEEEIEKCDEFIKQTRYNFRCKVLWLEEYYSGAWLDYADETQEVYLERWKQVRREDFENETEYQKELFRIATNTSIELRDARLKKRFGN